MENSYLKLKTLFESAAKSELATSMAKYMRNLFPFYGIQTPDRRKLSADIIKAEKAKKTINWEFVNDCYNDEHREFQYVACDYLVAMKDFLTYDDLTKLRSFITQKSWWDTIDILCKLYGYVGLKDDRVPELMLRYSKDKNIWVRRTAIQHQLVLRNKTNTSLLEKIIINCLGTNEFFINKAIGWALREYSKTDPAYVARFIDKYRSSLSPLSIREGSKFL